MPIVVVEAGRVDESDETSRVFAARVRLQVEKAQFARLVKKTIVIGERRLVTTRLVDKTIMGGRNRDRSGGRMIVERRLRASRVFAALRQAIELRALSCVNFLSTEHLARSLLRRRRCRRLHFRFLGAHHLV